jgi:hypothetical protein
MDRPEAPLDLVMGRGTVVDGDDLHIGVNPRVLAATGLTKADVKGLAHRRLTLIRRRRAQ